MKTVFDLVSLIMFAGLAILYLQRSASPQPDSIALWKYAVAAIGCATADYLGDQGHAVMSVVVFAALIVFALLMLRPMRRRPSR